MTLSDDQIIPARPHQPRVAGNRARALDHRVGYHHFSADSRIGGQLLENRQCRENYWKFWDCKSSSIDSFSQAGHAQMALNGALFRHLFRAPQNISVIQGMML